MPPRHTYWTIILEGKPTAFRAHTEEELLPTLKQLQARHPDAVMRWFARGKLWHSQEEERLARTARDAKREKRGRDWRPGGTHRDPRERFDVPRDERRRRFRERLFRDRQEGGNPGKPEKLPGADQESPRKPPPAGARPPARENRRPWRPHPDRPRQDEGERSTRGESQPRGWKPKGPPRDGRGWRPKGPTGRGSGGPRGGGGRGGGNRGGAGGSNRGGGGGNLGGGGCCNRGGGGGGNRGGGGGGRGGPR